MPTATRIIASVLTGKVGGIRNGIPNRAAQRCMSAIIHRPLAGTTIGLALPVALNTPPSRIGRQTICAPAAAAILGNWVHAT